MSEPAIKEGQIWRERTGRFTRFVKVVMILRPRGVKIKTCTQDGDFTAGARETEANRDRFAKVFDFVSGPQ